MKKLILAATAVAMLISMGFVGCSDSSSDDTATMLMLYQQQMESEAENRIVPAGKYTVIVNFFTQLPVKYPIKTDVTVKDVKSVFEKKFPGATLSIDTTTKTIIIMVEKFSREDCSVWDGAHELSWDNGLSIDHNEFDTNMSILTVSFKDATEGACIKLTVSDPSSDCVIEVVEGGTLNSDNAIAISGEGTVSVLLDSETVKKIIGQEKEGALGGLTILGQNATVTKVKYISFEITSFK